MHSLVALHHYCMSKPGKWVLKSLRRKQKNRWKGINTDPEITSMSKFTVCTFTRQNWYIRIAVVGHVAVPGAEHGWAGIWLCSAGLWACCRVPACCTVRPYCPGTEGWDHPGLTGRAGAEEPCLEPAWWQYGPHGTGRGQDTQKPCVCVCVWGRQDSKLAVW